MSRNTFAREVAMVGVMAALANALAFIALPGPLNIQFGLTGIPILLIAFTYGPTWGALCGLLGGIIQATKYGHLAYVVYTMIQGGVAGLFAVRLGPEWTRRLAPFFMIIGGFLLAFFVDLLRNTRFTLSDLGTTSFSDASKVFGMEIHVPLPIVAIGVGLAALLVTTVLVVTEHKQFKRNSFLTLTFAGCFGAIAYVPYDAWVLYRLQGYPWLPTWFVLSKDLIQDFIASALCALLLRNPRVRNVLERDRSG
jgi:Thiamine transporter protein (Thia_YuaJ)